jgi:hypothetical protein
VLYPGNWRFPKTIDVRFCATFLPFDNIEFGDVNAIHKFFSGHSVNLDNDASFEHHFDVVLFVLVML